MIRACQVLVSLAIWALSASWAARAVAQATNPPQSASTATSAPPGKTAEGLGEAAQSAGSAARQAQDAYERAMAAYAMGDTLGALDAMRESYRISGKPELLYNLARLQRELHECSQARADFLAYLERAPDGQYRENAEQACHELERECENAAAVKNTPRTPPNSTADTKTAAAPEHGSKAPAAYWTAPRVLAWSAISAGVLSGAGALYFQFAALAARKDVATSVNQAYMGGPHWNEARQGDQHRDSAVAQVLGVASGALVAGGALVLILGPHSSGGRTSAAIGVAPGLLEARYSQAF